MPGVLLVGLVACALAVACESASSPTDSSSAAGDPPPRWLDDTTAPPPALLSGVGLFDAVATRAVRADLALYTPRFPLYSDGLDKERLVYLPPGAAIDPTGPTWTFPVGTVFAKTFVEGGTPIESRLLFRRADAWAYAAYAWRADGSDADLLEGNAGNWAALPVTTPTGATHDIPSRLDCRSCHETHAEVAGHPVLGVSALQVDAAFAASAAFATPPAVVNVEGRTPAETVALGYFVGNCLSCHTGGEATNASFSLAPSDAITTTVNVPTESETGEGIRVVPGDPEASVLFVSVVLARRPDYEGPFKAMPPVGSRSSDPTIEAPLRAWIEGL